MVGPDGRSHEIERKRSDVAGGVRRLLISTLARIQEKDLVNFMVTSSLFTATNVVD